MPKLPSIDDLMKPVEQGGIRPFEVDLDPKTGAATRVKTDDVSVLRRGWHLRLSSVLLENRCRTPWRQPMHPVVEIAQRQLGHERDMKTFASIVSDETFADESAWNRS